MGQTAIWAQDLKVANKNVMSASFSDFTWSNSRSLYTRGGDISFAVFRKKNVFKIGVGLYSIHHSKFEDQGRVEVHINEEAQYIRLALGYERSLYQGKRWRYFVEAGLNQFPILDSKYEN